MSPPINLIYQMNNERIYINLLEIIKIGILFLPLVCIPFFLLRGIVID